MGSKYLRVSVISMMFEIINVCAYCRLINLIFYYIRIFNLKKKLTMFKENVWRLINIHNRYNDRINIMIDIMIE
jgi:hypothetical protein